MVGYLDLEPPFLAPRPDEGVREETAMRPRHLSMQVMVLVLAVALGAGCSASQLQAQKDDTWSTLPRALPDGLEPGPAGFGHPLRVTAIILNPIGVALDYAFVRPFYLLAGLAPEWFGLTAEDVQKYNEHMPTLVVPKTAPQRYENLQPPGGSQP